MIAYTIIMFCVSVLFFGLGFAIQRGRTDLIHDYHQTRVTDKAAYGKAFAKAMYAMAAAMLISGIVSLLGESDAVAIASVAVLFVGLAVGFIWIAVVQKTYNKGMF